MSTTLDEITEDSSRAELEEALMNYSTTAGRMLRYDGIGRTNEAWVKMHKTIDIALTCWQAARA